VNQPTWGKISSPAKVHVSATASQINQSLRKRKRTGRKGVGEEKDRKERRNCS
jgi:hypothetical protein